MPHSPWARLAAESSESNAEPWLPQLLRENAHCAYLKRFGSPSTICEFVERVPSVSYEELLPWLERICQGEANVLFTGRPVAYERTGGSTGGAKLIPYSALGLRDFQRAILPWLTRTVNVSGIRGKAYLAISPGTRKSEAIGSVPVGLPDGAYLGEAVSSILADVSAVPPSVGSFSSVQEWRAATLSHLMAAHDLELISVWSPTFLLRLLDHIPDPVSLWPRLKVVSCWASATSQPFAAELAARLPQAKVEPKGLMSTECVVTMPDLDGRPVLNRYGFFEFERNGRVHPADGLIMGGTYEVLATTASGLYRYRTGDQVRCDGFTAAGAPILEFIGRGSLVSDLVGEKLVEPFVAACLAEVSGFCFLAPDVKGDGYLLLTERGAQVNLERIESGLCGNPQYEHARRLGQLQCLRHLEVDRLFDRYVRIQLDRGVRLADVKTVALHRERDWIAQLR